MGKGIKGHTLVVVISIIIATIGVVIYWLFIQGSMEPVIKFGREISCSLCMSISNMVPGGGFLLRCSC